nr:MAG: ORF1 [TTV-like mini virus]
MPPFYRYRYRWRRPWNRRRRRFRTRRFRYPVRRRFYRRRLVRKKRWNFYKKKKAKKITVKQWNPEKIRKCTIKGPLPLFICGKTRICHNYTLFSESIVPVGEAGGGGWSILQITLRVLFDQYKKYLSWWTTSNQGLPLLRYHGCKITFYKSAYTDYVVVPQICPPFSVTRDMYLNCHPARLLMDKRKIIVPRQQKNKKNYIKRFFHPPDLLKSNWYFQQDMCNVPLIMFSTSACSLEQMYAPENQISDNYTFYSLNTDFFVNNNFADPPNGKYSPKTDGTRTYYLYTEGNGSSPTKWTQVIPLFNVHTYTTGKVCTNFTEFEKKENWGNPFYHHYSDPSVKIYYTDQYPTSSNFNTQNVTFTPLHELFFECRYNPRKDTGIGNTVYMKSNKLTQGTINTEPTKEDIVITDFPLWLIFYSWLDWLEKLKPIQHILQDYYFIVKSPFITPKRQSYLFLDMYFVRPNQHDLTPTQIQNWYPKYEMQEEVQYYFAEAGVATPKVNRSQLIQAHIIYKMYFKWGGCPAPMELIVDPCQQDKFPLPSNQQQRHEIQDPETDKESYLYKWDERRHTITTQAAKRLKSTDFTKSITGLPTDPTIKTSQKEKDQTQTEKEIKAPQIQLLQLRRNLNLLRHRLLQLKNQET